MLRERVEVWRHFLGLVLLALALTACESDEKRLERLQTEAAMARLTVLKWQQRAEDGTGSSDSLNAAQNRLILVEREMNRFMEGR